MADHTPSSSQGASPPQNLPTKSASGAPTGLFRRHHRIRRAKWCRNPRIRPCRVENIEAVP
eukprot:6015120-Alexandrium_andersonii.AAC.1